MPRKSTQKSQIGATASRGRAISTSIAAFFGCRVGDRPRGAKSKGKGRKSTDALTGALTHAGVKILYQSMVIGRV